VPLKHPFYCSKIDRCVHGFSLSVGVLKKRIAEKMLFCGDYILPIPVLTRGVYSIVIGVCAGAQGLFPNTPQNPPGAVEVNA
jgi:hypothetical protein